MPRHVLSEDRIHPTVRQKIADNHRDIVDEVIRAVEKNDVVVVGMALNPNPRRACNLLEKRGIAYSHLSYGSYLTDWRRRNALKMWTGWPTFPMIFVKGTFIGGADDLERLAASGELERLLAARGSSANTASAPA